MQEGRQCSAFDLTYNAEWMDILSDKGFTLATYLVLNTRRGGGLTLAPVCSTWVFLWISLIRNIFFSRIESLLS